MCVSLQFGEIDIDSELVVKKEVLEGTTDTVLQLSNGCLCCTVRDDLIQALNKLVSGQPCDQPQHMARTHTAVHEVQNTQRDGTATYTAGRTCSEPFLQRSRVHARTPDSLTSRRLITSRSQAAVEMPCIRACELGGGDPLRTCRLL